MQWTSIASKKACIASHVILRVSWSNSTRTSRSLFCAFFRKPEKCAWSQLTSWINCWLLCWYKDRSSGLQETARRLEQEVLPGLQSTMQSQERRAQNLKDGPPFRLVWLDTVCSFVSFCAACDCDHSGVLAIRSSYIIEFWLKAFRAQDQSCETDQWTMGALDAQSLVIYEDSEVIGVKEFHVAKALLEGQEGLSALVPSQWGPVHLFDLCMWFGLSDTALALVLHGVTGCKLEEHHLGALPDAKNAPVHRDPGDCDCEGWKTCRSCCWGFPMDNGIWMKDSEARLRYAEEAARKAAKTPLVNCILDIFCKDEVLPLALSDEAAARLLDIAMLCGNSQAAANLAKSCPVRPLRRWREYQLHYAVSGLQMLSAGLLAGANFQDLRICYSYAFEDSDGEDEDLEIRVEVPHLLWRALRFDSEDWQRLGQFFSSKPWWPRGRMQLEKDWFFDCSDEDGRQDEDDSREFWISLQKVQNALRSGWNLQHMWMRLFVADTEEVIYPGLLDLAILCGESGCADALATAGVQLREECLEWLQEACRGGQVLLVDDSCFSDLLLVASASECMSAASAAACASFRRSFKSEGAGKGVAVYQTLAQKFRPRGVGRALVQDILAFSMEVPKILDQLDLWDEVRDWLPPRQRHKWRRLDGSIGGWILVDSCGLMDVDGIGCWCVQQESCWGRSVGGKKET